MKVLDRTYQILDTERSYLRELAKKYLSYAHMPIMEERTKLWTAHNSFVSEQPVIMMENETFKHDILSSLNCTSPLAIEIEKTLLLDIINKDLINDDKVISPYYVLPMDIHIKEFGIDKHVQYASNDNGKQAGFAVEHPIKNLVEDIQILKPSEFLYNPEQMARKKEAIEDIIGDILPVILKNQSVDWHMAPSMKVVELMGLEAMMYALIDCPDEIQQLYTFIVDDMIRYLRWQENNGLLTMNNGNDYAGSGSYGFTDKLSAKGDIILSRERWGNMNSQETVSISPQMYRKDIYPHYERLAKEFGFIYYGCCEPVHDIWKGCLENLPNIRKVSVSPWCNEEIMGDYLRGVNVIYCRKPSPNFIGLGKFNESSFREHIMKTINAAKGCHLEFSFRDIYTLDGDLGKPGKAVSVVRELLDQHWQG